MTQPQDERLGLPSASNWRRYELCAGSWQLEGEARQLNQLAHETSPAAQRGELIHAWLAGIPDEDGNEIKLDDSEQQTADLLQERAIEQAERIFGQQPVGLLSEKRLWLEIKGQKVASGRFDRCLWTQEIALVQDFKTSQWVEPDKSVFDAQMRVLAILVGLHLPDTIKEVVTQIITGPWGVYEERFTRKDLADIYDATLATLRKINDPLAPLVPGISQCKYCAAAAICQSCRGLLSPPTKFQTAKLPLEPDRAAKLLDEIEILENAFEEVKKFYYNWLASDPTAKIIGYELVPNAARREIEDVEAAKSRLAEFLDSSELNAAMDLKVGQVEKLFGKKLGLRGRELREKFNAVMGKTIIEKTPNPSLKRTGVKPKFTEAALQQRMALNEGKV